MSCCDWQTFKDSLLGAFARRGIPSNLIDWKRSRRDWKRYHCTGEESAIMQVRTLSQEGEYNRLIPGLTDPDHTNES